MSLPTVGLLSHPLMMMDSAMRAYAHPKILSIAAGINGSDFVPFQKAFFIKLPEKARRLLGIRMVVLIGTIKDVASRWTMVVAKLMVLTCLLPVANVIRQWTLGLTG